MAIKHTVDMDKLNPTLDEMEEFINEARSLGIPGDSKIKVVGTSEGYHFAGTYQFTPKALRAGG